MLFDANEKDLVLNELAGRNPSRELALVVSCDVQNDDPNETFASCAGNGLGKFFCFLQLLAEDRVLAGDLAVHVGEPQKRNGEIALVGKPADLSLVVAEWATASFAVTLASYMTVRRLRLTKPTPAVLRLQEPEPRVALLQAASPAERQSLAKIKPLWRHFCP
jgi:hypothetical protein